MSACLQRLKPYSRWLLATVLSLGSFYLALRRVSLSDVWIAFQQAEWGWVVLALGSVFMNTFSKAARWNILCAKPGKAILFRYYLAALLTGQALNTLYPARVGDLVRAQYLGRQGPGTVFILGTIVTEKVLDMLAYAFLLIALLLLLSLPVWLNAPAYGIIFLGMALGLSLWFLTWRGNRLFAFIGCLPAWIPPRLRQWLISHGRLALSSLDILNNARSLLLMSILTILIWSTAALNNYLVFRSLRLSLSPLVAVVLLVALQAGISFPSMPGGIGIFEYTCVLVLGLWGVTEPLAFSCGILLHTIVMLPSTLIGLVCFWLLGMASKKTP